MTGVAAIIEVDDVQVAVVKTDKETRICVGMPLAHAVALRALTGTVSGDFEQSIRSYTRDVFLGLTLAGVPWADAVDQGAIAGPESGEIIKRVADQLRVSRDRSTEQQ